MAVVLYVFLAAAGLGAGFFVGRRTLRSGANGERAHSSAGAIPGRAADADGNRLHAVVENMAEGLICVGPDGHVTLMNTAAETLTGFTRKEALSRPLAEVFNVVCEETHRPAEDIVSKVLQSGKPCGFSSYTALVSKNRAERPLAVTASPVPGDNGAPSGVVVSFEDVTEGRKLRLESRRFNMMVEQAAQGIAATDVDGNITFANATMAALHGYQPDELIGKHLKVLYAPGQVSSSEAFLELVRRNGNHVGEVMHLRKDGTTFRAEIKVSLLKEGAQAIGMVVFVLDITQRKLVEVELQAAKEMAEAASRSKSEFLANMSHEIRTPMNGVIGMTELVLDTTLTREQREYLEALKASADSLLTILNDILDISKIEAGRLELEPIEFGLRSSLSEILKTLAVRAHTKNLEVIYHVEPDVPDNLIGDAGRLRQIVVNLVGNAIKFTERGEVGVHVKMETHRDGEARLLFDVSDTGIGIPVDKQTRIFGAFFQADSSTTRKYGGTGLGLAISSRLVKMMDGRIWVESPSPLRTPAGGAGTVFHFTARFNVGAGQPASPSSAALPDIENLSVLVADDNATNRRLLGEMLKGWRMNLRFADGGRTALDMMKEARAARKPFSLVILDASMPGMDGFAIAEHIKEDPELAAATIMLLTSVGIRGDAARCNKLGVSAYLVKPVTQSDLLDAITRVLCASDSPKERVQLVTRHSLREEKRGAGIRILLAEDNPVNQMLATRLLEKRGYSVQLADNGKKALEILEKAAPGEYAVVLMDVQMPQMDGYEATAGLRKLEAKAGRHTPIIALTAHAMKGDRERCLAAGMDDYVTKPIHAKDLFAVIDRMVPAAAAPAPNAPAPAQAAPPDDEAQNGALDKSEVLSRVDGDLELLKELKDIFVAEYPKLLAQAREAMNASNAEALGKTAHTIKGMLANLGAKAAADAALRLEKMGTGNELSGADEAYAAIEKEIERFSRALAALLKESGK